MKATSSRKDTLRERAGLCGALPLDTLWPRWLLCVSHRGAARCMCPFSPAMRWICCWGPARWILRRCGRILAGILALVALTAAGPVADEPVQ